MRYCQSCKGSISNIFATKYCSRKCVYLAQIGRRWNKSQRLRYSQKRRGKNNPAWKGHNVSYGALHDWVKWWLKKPKKCPSCSRNVRLDLANISQKYKRDLSDWEWLCRRCHMIKDGRLKKFVQVAKQTAQKLKRGKDGRYLPKPSRVSRD